MWQQVVKIGSWWKSADCSISIISCQSMVPSSLYVESCEVHARSLVLFLEEVVCHFRGHHTVHGHHGGHDHASDQIVQFTLKEEFRIVEDLPQRNISCSFASLLPAHPGLLLTHQGQVWPNKTVAKSEGCSCKLVEHSARALRVVALVVARGEESEAEAIKNMSSKDARKELRKSYMLHESPDDASSLGKKFIRTPMPIDLAQLGGNVVVLPHHHRVEDRQPRLLVDSVVPSEEAVAVNCSAVGMCSCCGK